MSELVAQCPRCGSSQITFDVKSSHHVKTSHGWQPWFETFSVCRHCNKSTVFLLSLRQYELKDDVTLNGLAKWTNCLNSIVDIEGFINLKDLSSRQSPEFLPQSIESAFREGATCFAVGCYNAAATMFRLCIDLATKPLLPENDEDGLTKQIRRNLGLRLPWLFSTERLPPELQELSSCIKDDGNDGAHDGTLNKADAEDILDFAFEFLERLFTEPERLRLAKERREERRKAKTT
jgi:hypothetical protein